MFPLKLQKARWNLVVARPYLAAALLRLIPVECEGVKTMAVSKNWVLYYAPSFVEKREVQELMAVLMHELEHLLRTHHERLKTYPEAIAQVAGDCEINDGYDPLYESLPAGKVVPSLYGLPEGRLAEEYAEELMKRAEKVEVSYRSGSCATGRRQEYEKEVEGISEAEGEAIRREVARAVKEWGQGQGNVPDGLRRWAEELLESKVDWRRELAAHIRRAVGWKSGASDYSFSRMNRRQAAFAPFILPGLVEPVAKIAVIIDTSASISDEMLEQAVAELRKILWSLPSAEVLAIVCDAEVKEVKRVKRPEELKYEGGGGTDMRVALAKAEELAVDVAVVLTDGWTDWPSEPLRAAVVVGLLAEPPEFPPEWMKVVRVE